MSKSLEKTRDAVELCSDLELAWLAGIVDGEGSLKICRDKNRLTMFLSINMTHFPTMKKIADLTGSFFHIRIRGGNRKPLFCVSISGRRAAVVVKAVKPYLVTKAEQADVLLEFSPTIRNTGAGEVSKTSLSLREDLREKILILNGSKK